MKQEKPLITSIFVVLCLIVFIILLIVMDNQKDQKKFDNEKYINNNIIALKNNNRFLTIKSALDNYILSIKDKEVDALLLMLDQKYVEENYIDTFNVLDKLDYYNSNYIVNVREVYQVRSYDNIYIYYIKAKLIEDVYSSVIDRYIRDVYFKVTINENTLAFAIAPLEEENYLSKVGDVDERK